MLRPFLLYDVKVAAFIDQSVLFFYGEEMKMMFQYPYVCESWWVDLFEALHLDPQPVWDNVVVHHMFCNGLSGGRILEVVKRPQQLRRSKLFALGVEYFPHGEPHTGDDEYC